MRYLLDEFVFFNIFHGAPPYAIGLQKVNELE